MKKRFILLFLLLPGLILQAQTPDETAVRKLLNDQVQAWNRGSLDDFMKGYWHSDSLVFVGKTGLNYGYAKALANYKKGYPDRAAMGTLFFTLLRLDPLSPEYYFVTGKWLLKRKAGDVGGIFTLLFRKIGGEWVIVCDHTG